MSDWTDGYVAEVGYTFGYYAELNPVRIALPFLNVGLAPPTIATACELGYGQGLSVNIHAAAGDALWWGTDFNPAHAAFAQSLAAAAGADARLFDQSFAEFCARGDLPDFDYIGLHGTWSWVSAQNQSVIVDFVRRKLKVGGVLYISYNTLPGHAATVPLRHLLTLHAATMAPPGQPITGRIDGALDFADKLMELKPGFASVNPTIAERLARIKGQDRHYLAHEYFNRDWSAMPFAELAQRLALAKLTYACSATVLDHVDALHLTAQHHQFLGAITDPNFRQSVRDFIVNQQFRADYWVKGARRLSALEQTEAIRRLRVVLVSFPRSAVKLTMQSAVGERELSAAIYDPILDQLADRGVRSIGEIEAALAEAGIRLPAIYEAVMLLAGKGDIVVAQDETAAEHARQRTDRLNLRLLDKARSSSEIGALATPVIGGGVLASRIQQLFLLARRQGSEGVEDMARFAWDLLAAQNQHVVKDGAPLQSPEDNLAELVREAREFVDNRLPVFRTLQIA